MTQKKTHLFVSARDRGANNRLLGVVNARFLLGKPDHFRLHIGNCGIRGRRIVAFDMDETKFDSTWDVCGAIVVPCFHNAHLHLGEALFSPLDGPWDLDSYLLLGEWWNHHLGDAAATAWTEAARFTAERALSTGTGGVCSARGHTIFRETGLKGLSGYPIMQSDKLRPYTEAGIQGYQRFKAAALRDHVLPGLFIHSLYANDKASLEFARACHDSGAGFVTVHVAETEASSARERKRWSSPLKTLFCYGLLTPTTLLVHGGLLTTEELRLVAKSGASLVLCPVSAHTLSAPCLNPDTLNALGIRWCIGTDGLGTGRTADLMVHLRATGRLFPQISRTRLWSAATDQAAQIMGMPNTGYLWPGANADMSVFRDVECSSAPEFLEHIFADDSFKAEAFLVNGRLLPDHPQSISLRYKPNFPLTTKEMKSRIGNYSLSFI